MSNNSVKLVDVILRYAFLSLLIIAFFLKRYGNKELGEIFSTISLSIGISLVIFKLLCWLFPKWFTNKPTINQIEEKQFGVNTKK